MSTGLVLVLLIESQIVESGLADGDSDVGSVVSDS